MNLENRLYRIEEHEEMKNNVRQAVAHLLNTNNWTREIEEKHRVILRTVNKLQKQINIHICKADK